MHLKQISRELKGADSQSMIPSRENWILESEVLNYFKDSENTKLNQYPLDFKGELISVIDIIVYFDTNLEFALEYSEGQIRIVYSGEVCDEIVVFCSSLAIGLKAMLLSEVNVEYPKSKIQAAQQRLARKPQASQVVYQKESFGGNNMWLAIWADLEEVRRFFKLEGVEKPWGEALEKMHACEGMFMSHFRGWTFIAGQKTEILFNCQVKGETAIEKCHADKLLDWGKVFSDVQLFMHYNRSMYFNAFYRVLNGEILYGEYETESYDKKYGKLPAEIKDLPDSNANTIASVWSYDPDYLRYEKELTHAIAWVVDVKQRH